MSSIRQVYCTIVGRWDEPALMCCCTATVHVFISTASSLIVLILVFVVWNCALQQHYTCNFSLLGDGAALHPQTHTPSSGDSGIASGGSASSSRTQQSHSAQTSPKNTVKLHKRAQSAEADEKKIVSVASSTCSV